MSTRRRSAPSAFEGQASDDLSSGVVSPSPPAERQTSVRLSRRSTGSSGAGRGSSRGRNSSSSARTRRPTPVVRRKARARSADSSRQLSDIVDDEYDEQSPSPATRRRRASNGARSSGARQGQAQVSARRSRGGVTIAASSYSAGGRRESDGVSELELTWYERLMPEFILNLTAPLTGYEARLDIEDADEIDDVEYDILERQRLKRNKRVRRRLLTIVALATAASVFMYTRGKLFRKTGVKAAVSSMKHRLEDGLTKSIQETMGK